MGDGKWLNQLKPAMPLADAARLALTARLETVRDALRRAVAEPDTPSNVHDLRVATRRARAALDVFRICLPKKRYRKARNGLSHFRRAAGGVRDWDVFVATLAKGEGELSERDRPGFDFLLGFALAQRRRGQDELATVSDKYAHMLKRCQHRLLPEVRCPHGPQQKETLGEAAPVSLVVLFDKLGLCVQRNLFDYANLHQVRVAGKRLRYAMELFAECFPPAFKEEVYPKIEEMQGILGEANDSHMACERIAALRMETGLLLDSAWERLRPGIDAVQNHHHARQEAKRSRFEEWWHQWRGPDGDERLLRLLREAANREVSA